MRDLNSLPEARTPEQHLILLAHTRAARAELLRTLSPASPPEQAERAQGEAQAVQGALAFLRHVARFIPQGPMPGDSELVQLLAADARRLLGWPEPKPPAAPETRAPLSCPNCSGEGQLYRRASPFESMTWEPCAVCGGTGQVTITAGN